MEIMLRKLTRFFWNHRPICACLAEKRDVVEHVLFFGKYCDCHPINIPSHLTVYYAIQVAHMDELWRMYVYEPWHLSIMCLKSRLASNSLYICPHFIVQLVLSEASIFGGKSKYKVFMFSRMRSNRYSNGESEKAFTAVIRLQEKKRKETRLKQ